MRSSIFSPYPVQSTKIIFFCLFLVRSIWNVVKNYILYVRVWIPIPTTTHKHVESSFYCQKVYISKTKDAGEKHRIVTKGSLWTIVPNELKFGTNYCINKLNLCAKFLLLSSNRALTKKLPITKKPGHKKVFPFSSNWNHFDTPTFEEIRWNQFDLLSFNDLGLG